MGLLAGACFRLKCTWAGDLALIKNPPKKEDFPMEVKTNRADRPIWRTLLILLYMSTILFIMLSITMGMYRRVLVSMWLLSFAAFYILTLFMLMVGQLLISC